jgi:hypothetical protein
LGFGVWGLGFEFWGLGFGVYLANDEQQKFDGIKNVEGCMEV